MCTKQPMSRLGSSPMLSARRRFYVSSFNQDLKIRDSLLKHAQIAVGTSLNADRSHSDLLGHQRFHDVFRTVQALVRRRVGAGHCLLKNRSLWLLLSDLR